MHGPLTGTWLAICALAYTLGIRHGLDADHLATIDGLARRNAVAHPRLARFSGTLFSIGHGVIVLLVAVAASLLAGGWQTPEWLEFSGTAVSVVFLLGLAFLNLHAVWTTPRHQVVTPAGLKSRLFSRLAAVDRPLFIVGIGMLFALSFDTVSQAALFAVAASRFGGVGHALIVATCFVAGMMTADGLNGFWIARLIGRADKRAAVASRVMAIAVGSVSLLIGAFTLIKLVQPAVEAWADAQGILIGLGVIALVAASFVLAMLLATRTGAPARTAARNTPAE